MGLQLKNHKQEFYWKDDIDECVEELERRISSHIDEYKAIDTEIVIILNGVLAEIEEVFGE